jgi:hypothetical protein
MGWLLAWERAMTTGRNSVASLIEKRRELARTIKTLQEELDRHWGDLGHIDATLRIILGHDPDPEMIRPKRRYQRAPYFGRNELSRLVLITLRTVAEPIGIQEISRRVVVAKGFDPGDASLHAAIRERIRPIVTRLHKQSTIEGVSSGRGSKWKLAGTSRSVLC